MKLFSLLFESRTPKPTEEKISPRQAAALQQARHKDVEAKICQSMYVQYGPRVARHMVRSLKKGTASKEEHTCLSPSLKNEWLAVA